MLFLSILIIILPVILTFLALMLFKKIQANFQLMMPFECGFNPLNSSRIPFSLQFFLLAILFLIFDVEITLLLPFPLSFPLPSSFIKYLIMLFFILILFLGIIIEWLMKTLDWIY